jgi:hypothetical protein
MGSSKERRIKPAAFRKRHGNQEIKSGDAAITSNFVSSHVWKNGMRIEARLHEKSFTSESSDCISLEIRPAPGHGSPALFYLNVEDAVAIINALSSAVGKAIEERMPIWPEGN